MRYSVILIAPLILTACATRPAVVANPVPTEESMVRTADEAVRIALAFVKRENMEDEIQLETAKAYEQPDVWRISINKVKDVRPSVLIISVDKRTAKAVVIPLR